MDNSSASLELQIQKLDEKIKASNLPSDLLEKIESMINLLRTTLKSGTASFISFETVSNYVNWITSLPFNKETKDILDLHGAKQILDKNHYGLLNVKNRIIEYLSSIILTIVLLVWWERVKQHLLIR